MATATLQRNIHSRIGLSAAISFQYRLKQIDSDGKYSLFRPGYGRIDVTFFFFSEAELPESIQPGNGNSYQLPAVG